MSGEICWAVLAPLPASELRDIVLRRWKLDAPFSTDAPPWDVVEGSGDYSAVVSKLPGTEGSDRIFAPLLSQIAEGSRIYSIWFDPELQAVSEWKQGEQIGSREGHATELFESLGFTPPRPVPLRQTWSAAVLENVSADDVRRALADLDPDTWLNFETGRSGVLMTTKDGSPGVPAWEAAEALPNAIIYELNHIADPETLNVLVLKGGTEAGTFQVPVRHDNPDLLPGIKGQQTPARILSALDIPPRYLGYDCGE
jgi:hypothetical protein